MDRRLTHRATLLQEWKGSESYELAQVMLQEWYDAELLAMAAETATRFDYHQGVLEGLRRARDLVTQTLLDETRQQGREETSHAG